MMDEPVTNDDLELLEAAEDPALTELKAEVKDLQIKNDNAVARLVRQGLKFDPADIGRERDNHLCEWIYENLLTDEAQQLFLKSWHEKFGAALARTEKNARMATIASGAALAKIRPQAPGGAVPGGGIVLPPGVRRPGR